MKYLFSKFLVLAVLTTPALGLAHSELSSVRCDNVQGLQIMEDFTPDEKPFTSKKLTELYTSRSDDGFMTHIVVDNVKFKDGNVNIIVEIVNSNKQTLKKYILKHWALDTSFPDKKVNKVNILNFLKSKVTEPYDSFANLDKAAKSKVNKLKVPFDAKISVANENQKPFCTFDFHYGSISPY